MEQPTVYIDTIFLINFVVNYLLLLASAKITAVSFKRIRLVLGAFFGALYAVAAVLMISGVLGHAVMKLAVAVIMTIIAFGLKPSRGLLKQVLVFAGVSFALAGCVMALYLLSGKGFGINSGILYFNINAKILILIAACCYVLFGLVFRAAARISGKSSVQKVRVFFKSREVGFSALVDTGNTLRDPLNHAPVMVAEFNTIVNVLPDDLKPLLTKNCLKDPACAMELAGMLGYGRHFRLVPYRAVGTDCGMLLALRPDRVEINGIRKDGVIVAISPGRLSDGAGYTALSGLVP